jgi:hypothetical protein
MSPEVIVGIVAASLAVPSAAAAIWGCLRLNIRGMQPYNPFAAVFAANKYM